MTEAMSAQVADDAAATEAALLAFRRESRKGALQNIGWGTALIAVHVPFMIFTGADLSVLSRSLLWIIGVVIAGSGVWGLRSARTLTADDLEHHRRAVELSKELDNMSAPSTVWMLLCIWFVGFAQLYFEEARSIQAAGLVKSAVRDGEYWRLLTCAVLHGNFVHITMNAQSLFGLGRLTERLTSHSFLPIVFLISAFFGSVFSLILMPNTTSIGASGGLMGLVGFLGVFGYRRKDAAPARFLRWVLINIASVGFVGLVGFAVIDNAAHFGGLVGGAMCGAILIPRTGDVREAGPFVSRLGQVSLIIIGLVSALAVQLMR